VCDFIILPTNGHIHNTTCVWFYHFTYKWTYPHLCDSFHLQMDISTIPHVLFYHSTYKLTYSHLCDFIIPPTNGLIHMCVILSFHLHMDLSTCVWFYHSTYTWTYPQYHVCVNLSFHLQMDLSTFVRFITPTNGHIHNTTCVWFYYSMSICRWNDKIIHVVLWICPFVGGIIKSYTCGIVDMWTYPQYHMCVIWSFHLQMDLPTKPHVCDFIVSPTNGNIHNTTCVWFYHFTYKWTYPQYHMCMILLFHLQMDISTIPRVWFYHSTYKWTYPHVCEFIIPPTNGYICNTTCVWFYHSTYKWTYPQYHMCVIWSFNTHVDKSICRWNDKITHVVLWICPFVGGIIKSYTCGIVDMSICRWNESHKCG
jgi:hypothetical protein